MKSFLFLHFIFCMLHWNEADSVTTFLSLSCSYFDDLIMLNLSMSMLRCCNWIVLYKSCACCVSRAAPVKFWSRAFSWLAGTLFWRFDNRRSGVCELNLQMIDRKSSARTGNARSESSCGGRAGALFMDRWTLSRVQESSALGSSLQRSGESMTFTHITAKRLQKGLEKRSLQHTVLQENTAFTSVEYISFVVICEIYLQFLSETFKSCNSFLV